MPSPCALNHGHALFSSSLLLFVVVIVVVDVVDVVVVSSSFSSLQIFKDLIDMSVLRLDERYSTSATSPPALSTSTLNFFNASHITSLVLPPTSEI